MTILANRYARMGPGPWRPQGPPCYLTNQAQRLGFSWQVPEHPRVKDNRQLARIANLTAEVCSNYFEPRQYDRAFSDHQIACARDTLARCEIEVQKTHCIAAASVEMIDEAWLAFGMDPPARPYAILDATGLAKFAALQAETEQLRAENERLRAENEGLAERLTAPADSDHVNSIIAGPPARN